jgi:hypothetical protein
MLTRNCIKKLPQQCSVDYGGALRDDDGRLKHEVQGDEGYALLSWDIHDEDFVIFTVTLTLLRSADSITSFKVDGQELWVNVSFVHQDQGVDKPLPRLGGRSVRKTVLLIHSEK